MAMASSAEKSELKSCDINGVGIRPDDHQCYGTKPRREGVEQTSGTVFVRNSGQSLWDLIVKCKEYAGLVDEASTGDRGATICFYSEDSARRAVEKLNGQGGITVEIDRGKPPKRTAAIFGNRISFGNIVCESGVGVHMETYKTLVGVERQWGGPDQLAHETVNSFGALLVKHGPAGLFFCLTDRKIRLEFKTGTGTHYRMEWPFAHVSLRLYATDDDDLHVAINFTHAPKLLRNATGCDHEEANRVDYVRITDPWKISDPRAFGGGQGGVRKGATALEVSWCVSLVCPGRRAHFLDKVAPSLVKAGILQHNTTLPTIQYDSITNDRWLDDIHRVSLELCEGRSRGQDTPGAHFLLCTQYQVLITNGILQGTRAVEPSFVSECLLSPSYSVKVKLYCLTEMEKPGKPIMNPKQEFERIAARGQRQLGLVHTLMEYPEHCMRILHVDVTPLKMYVRGPFVEQSNRVLRRYRQHTDHFVRGRFTDEDGKQLHYHVTVAPLVKDRIQRILEEGVRVGHLPPYVLLGFSSSQVREQSAWLLRPDKDKGLTLEQIWSFMGDFSHIKQPSKFAARMGQCFSATQRGICIHPSEVVRVDDIARAVDPGDHANDAVYEFTDGAGYCHESVAEDLATQLKLDFVPHAFQIRFNGAKGMLQVDLNFRDKHPRPYRLALRPSQTKFTAQHNILEVCDNGYARFIPLHLNREIITLLLTREVPPRVFHEIFRDAMGVLNKATTDKDAALQMLRSVGRESVIGPTLVKLLTQTRRLDGDRSMRDPFVLKCLREIRRLDCKMIETKTHLFVNEGAVLFGVPDETGVLNYGEIHLRIQRPDEAVKTVKGKVVVTKNPAFDPGDTRVFEAVDRPRLRHCVNVIVFPVKGPRPHPNELSGSDLDGDMYHAIWDPRCVPPTTNPPGAEYYKPRPKRLPESYFIDYFRFDTLGKIAVAWLNQCHQPDIYAEQKARHPTCLELAELHSDAVDFAKTGEPVVLSTSLIPPLRPDFLATAYHEERGRIFVSNSVIGDICRQAKQEERRFEEEDERCPMRVEVVDGVEVRTDADGQPMWRLVQLRWVLPCTLTGLVEGHIIKWRYLPDPEHMDRHHVCDQLRKCTVRFKDLVHNTHSSATTAKLCIPLHVEAVQFQVQCRLTNGSLSDPSAPSPPNYIDVEDKYKTAAPTLYRDTVLLKDVLFCREFDNGQGVRFTRGVTVTDLEKQVDVKAALLLGYPGPHVVGPVIPTTQFLQELDVGVGRMSVMVRFVDEKTARAFMTALHMECGGNGRRLMGVREKDGRQHHFVRVDYVEDPYIQAYENRMSSLSHEYGKDNSREEKLFGPPVFGRMRRIEGLHGVNYPENGERADFYNKGFLADQMAAIRRFLQSLALGVVTSDGVVDVLALPSERGRGTAPTSSLHILFESEAIADAFDRHWAQHSADDPLLAGLVGPLNPWPDQGRRASGDESSPPAPDAVAHFEQFYLRPYECTNPHTHRDR